MHSKFMNFIEVVQAINRFCSNVLSSTYHDIIKDRLYTLHANDLKRRSTQTALHLIFESLIKILGPMAPFTADEAWSYHKFGKDLAEDALALQSWPTVQEELGGWRRNIGSSIHFRLQRINRKRIA